MKNIAFLGASGEVTGSSYLLTLGNDEQILIDLGMFQGGEDLSELNYHPLKFNPAKLKAVFLTHAHLDHCGRLPLLIFGGYFGKIYMTAPTKELVEVILNDSAKVMSEDFSKKPIYTFDEVEKVLALIEIVEYDKPLQVSGVEAVFRDAGHILGSASIQLKDLTDSQTMVFSGDLGNFPEDIVRPTAMIDEAQIVVMECTYGDKEHRQEDVSATLQDEINIIEKNGGVLLIPAFSLERTQELLHRLHHLKKDGKIRADTPVFMDSPMAIKATVIFRDFKNFYNDEVKSHTDDPFSFEGLVLTEDARDSKEIIKTMDPKVIIAGSGMISGGRITHHAINYLPDPTTRILFVGYQAEDTVGKQVLEGAKQVRINKVQVHVKAHVTEVQSLSSHADQPKLLVWLGHIKDVKKVFLIHGDTKQRELFAEKVKAQFHYDVTLPKLEENLPLSTK
jgi:metallo-beta-lactamase family protein